MGVQVPPRQCYRGPGVQSRSLLPAFGNEGDLSALHISALRLLVRVCVAEAGSMATAHSRSRYMCAAVVYTRSRSCSLHRQEDMTPKPLSLPKSLACRALGRFERVGYRDAGAGAAA